MKNLPKSKELSLKAQKCIVGGVNSPVRAFHSVGGHPVFFEKGEGAYLFDVDGNSYLDFCASWGPLILGHAHEEVVEAIRKQSLKALSFGACHEGEIHMAEALLEAISWGEKVRLMSSGTEAVMTALRLARGATKRERIVKFEGCYHGHSDALLVAAGSGVLTSGESSSLGVCASMVSHTSVLPFQDIPLWKEYLEIYAQETACVILEPVVGNMGLIFPSKEFLKTIREDCTKYGIVLIFDEVITGFRWRYGSVGDFWGIIPDLITLGKIIGGGLPMGAVLGKSEIMDFLSPLGKVYQAGTLSGNPLSIAAGLQTLKVLQKENIYERLEKMTQKIALELNSFFKNENISCFMNTSASAFTLFCGISKAPQNLNEVLLCDTALYGKYFHFMLENGFYLPPSQFEMAFLNMKNTEEHINIFIHKTKSFFKMKCLDASNIF